MKFLPFCLLVLLYCCKTDTPPADEQLVEAETATTEVFDYSGGFPPLPAAQLQRLRDSVTYIDYLFYEQAFSMSMDERAGIEYALAGVSEAAPKVTAPCPAIGRVFYKIGGRTIEEADIHFAAGCTYLAFVGADKRPAYGNAFTEQGKSFFNGQFSQLVPDFQAIE